MACLCLNKPVQLFAAQIPFTLLPPPNPPAPLTNTHTHTHTHTHYTYIYTLLLISAQQPRPGGVALTCSIAGDRQGGMGRA